MLKLKIFLYLTFLLFSITNISAWSGIDSLRGIQLDSIVTNIPKEVRKDIVVLHRYIHDKAQNNEERVWMYFAINAIYIRYEKERVYKRKPKFYTPDYTLYKRKGVCRDQSELFGEMCKLSGIPCIQVVGKTPFNLILFLNQLIHFKIPSFYHQWCVVKINNNWSLMDPTWAKVQQIKKYYSSDKQGHRKTIGKCKIVSRLYYDAIPEFNSLTHKPFHPAFLLLANVPTYKSSFKEVYKTPEKRKYSQLNYNYNQALDSIYNNDYPELSSKLNSESYFYSKKNYSSYFFNKELSWHNNLTSKKYKPTLQDYYCHFEHLDSLSKYYEIEYGSSRIEYIDDYKENIDTLYIKKIEHKQRNRTKIKHY